MKKNSLALASALALLVNTIGMGVGPLPAMAAPVSASLDPLPAWFTTVDGERLPAGDPETYTDDAGRYRFEGLPHGTHKVTLDPTTLPPSLHPAEGEAVPVLWVIPGMDGTSDPFSTGVRFTAVYEREGDVISGLVFLDQDGDGQPDPGEPGLSGVRVVDPTVHQYFVPFDDANLWTLFDDKNTGLPGAQQCHTLGVPVAGTLNSSVFLIASADGTTFYYDHWEDGYDADPLVPGPTTEAGALDAGAIRIFQDDIDPAQVADPDIFYYDGRDRITVVGEEAAVVRQAYPSTPDPRLAAAWEIPEVADWGTSYVATVGEDLVFNPGGVEDHDFTGLEIMAALAGTEVFYNGASQGTLVAGGTVFIDGANDGAGGGGVNSTDTITATGPIQIQMMTGACGTRYSAHGYTLRPTSGWGVDYWVPVPGFSCGDDEADSDIYLHNPNGNAIEVTAVSDQGTAVIPVPIDTTISVLDYVVNNLGWIDISTGFEGLHLFSDDTFWGLGVIDSSSNGRSDSEIHDWGYTLIPMCACSSQAVVGYAPGNTAGPPPTDNGNLAFVAAVTDSVIYVDLNQDGLPDPFDMNGDGDQDDYDAWGVPEWDEPISALGIPLQAGRVLRVGDPYDRNLMGARIYTLSLAESIAVAWGQDPCQAGIASPYLDLGYTVLPVSIPRLSKVDKLAIDADVTGGVSPGDTITYTIVLHNNGQGAMTDVILTDPLPYTYTEFVVGSVEVTTPPPFSAIEYSSDGVNFGDPESPTIRAFRVLWPTVGPDQEVTTTFRVRLYTDIPIDVDEITNQAVVDSSETDPRLSEDPDDPTDPDTDTPVQRPLLSIDKRVSPTIVEPGGRVTYTLVISNYGNGVALLTQITDVLPSLVEYVPGTLDLTWPTAQRQVETRTITATGSFHGFYADDFDLSATEGTGYAGDDGSLAWLTDWTEINDDFPSDPDVGEVQAWVDGNALSEPSHAWMQDTDGDDAGIVRTIDLSDFRAPWLRYHVLGDVSLGDDNYRVEVTGVPDFVEEYAGAYTVREMDISAAAGDPAVSLSFVATGGLEPGELYRFDHISVYETDPQRVTQRLLASESFVLSYTTSTDGDPASYDPSTGLMVITDGMRLPAGGYITATYQVQVQSPLTDGLSLANTACVTAPNWLEILSPPCDDAIVLVQASHELTLTKSATPSPVAPGSLLTYTLRYAITGNEAVESMVVSDTTPANTTFYAAAPTATPTATLLSAPPVGGQGPVTWRLSGLWPPGSEISQATGTLRMVVLVDSELISGTQIRNAAIITDTTGMTDTDETTTTVILAADLAIVKTDEPDPVIPGETLTYTLQVINNGPAQAVNVVVTDTLPPEVTFVSADPPQISGPNPLAWNLGLLDPGETRLLTVVVTVLEEVDQTFTNTAWVDSDTTDIDLDNNRDDEPTSPPMPGLELVKTVNPYHAARNMPFTYRLRVTNTGDFPFTALRLEDQLDPRGNFSYIVGSGNPADPDIIAVPDLTWLDLVPDIGGPLVPGQSITVSYQVTTTAANDIYTNTATVEGVYPGGTLTDTDDATVAIADPAVDIDKRLIGVDQDDVAPNYITFTVAITNIGPSTIDVLPLYDEYDTFYLSFEGATPHPDEDADDGLVTWFDLTAPAPHGFGRNLPPRDTFIVTVVFRVVRDINSTINRAVVTDATDIHDNAADEVEDDVLIGGIPTAIEVLYFRAVAEETAVRLEWATAAEWDCGGFRLYRNPDPDFAEAQLIASFEAQGPGSTYSYIDREVAYNQAYWYWLAEVSATEPEREDMHGPVWGGVGPNALPIHVYLPLIRKGWAVQAVGIPR